MNRLTACLKIISKFVRGFAKKYDTGVLGELGRGAGKGGGGGGPIREAGGPFGKIGAAREEEYFHKQQKILLKELKAKLKEENELREREIEKHIKAIDNNKKLAKDVEDKIDEMKKFPGSRSR